jgi:hypothetical protein
VELKGGHVESALEQLQVSSAILCKRREEPLGVHDNEDLIQRFRKLAASGQGRRVLGYIVANKGLSLKQQERRRLQMDFGITVRLKRSAEGLTCAELASGFTS